MSSKLYGQMRASSSLLKRLKQNPWLSQWSRSFTTTEGHRPTMVHKRSLDILLDPWFNKVRDGFYDDGVRSSRSPRPSSSQLADLKRLEVQARDGPSDPYALAKWRIHNRLHDRNETMYYSVLIANIEEYAPIVYTPTVGLVCQNYSGLFRRPRGMYFSAEDRGEMMSMVYNWPADQVDMIVVTDGSRILGLGDLGVQGIGIAIGKLDLYVAAAGINPQRVLPVLIDVGTNNEKLLKDKTHCRHCLDGDEYIAVVDEFMEAFFTRWPHVIVQFEDFQSKWAFKLLQHYRTTYRMFNDDVQGTAGVAIAGLLGAVRAQGRPMIDFPKQKIVVAGAGSAGIGVLNAARKTMARMLGNNESVFESALRQFWVVDANGLITDERENIDPDALPFARKIKEIHCQGLREGASLVEVVKQVKCDVLLGLSAVGGLFSKEVLEALKGSTSTRPAIFTMSNPTKNVISYRQYFIRTKFIDHYQHKPQFLPCTLMIKYNYISTIDKKPFYKLFSEQSKILPGKSSSFTSGYLRFLPSPSVITRGSSKDLLLFSRSITEYYVCNPLTNQWLPLPKTPPNSTIRCGLVCDPKSTSVNTMYRVVLIYDDISLVNEFKVSMYIFCSKTGQWNTSTLLFPLNPLILWHSSVGWHRRAIASNGILYWLCGYIRAIVAFDPFKCTDCSKRFCLIAFPVGVTSWMAGSRLKFMHWSSSGETEAVTDV
ncbi:Malic oxidoreductase [Parasponia andersonii]|uniref:Malic enzyme n=1 Tax=Parasponia andersonii TaxID=3476 RepID=A0A2P5DWC9_PARAD|nr:Malic oxidoreductase [Parasponia andersonii]